MVGKVVPCRAIRRSIPATKGDTSRGRSFQQVTVDQHRLQRVSSERLAVSTRSARYHSVISCKGTITGADFGSSVFLQQGDEQVSVVCIAPHKQIHHFIPLSPAAA